MQVLTITYTSVIITISWLFSERVIWVIWVSISSSLLFGMSNPFYVAWFWGFFSLWSWLWVKTSSGRWLLCLQTFKCRHAFALTASCHTIYGWGCSAFDLLLRLLSLYWHTWFTSYMPCFLMVVNVFFFFLRIFWYFILFFLRFLFLSWFWVKWYLPAWWGLQRCFTHPVDVSC